MVALERVIYRYCLLVALGHMNTTSALLRIKTCWFEEILPGTWEMGEEDRRWLSDAAERAYHILYSLLALTRYLQLLSWLLQLQPTVLCTHHPHLQPTTLRAHHLHLPPKAPSANHVQLQPNTLLPHHLTHLM